MVGDRVAFYSRLTLQQIGGDNVLLGATGGFGQGATLRFRDPLPTSVLRYAPPPTHMRAHPHHHTHADGADARTHADMYTTRGTASLCVSLVLLVCVGLRWFPRARATLNPTGKNGCVHCLAGTT